MKNKINSLKYFLLLLITSFGSYAYAQDITIRSFPIPETVSSEMRPLVAEPPSSFWKSHPKNSQEWHFLINDHAQQNIKRLPQLRKNMDVTVVKQTINGVNCFVVMPKLISDENRNRILLHFHGGGYVLNPGEAGTDEAIMMAGYGHIKVISVDYRMAPDFPFPAAINDSVNVYRYLLKHYPSKAIGVFGTSTGGGITLALMLRLKTEHLSLPGAIVVGTPWTDMTKTGDSYFTNEGVDNVLVSYDGWLADAAKVYANGHNLKDPLLSPIYGDVKGLPPTLLFTGTRDLFLSNTIRMYEKLRDAGVIADLVVFEGVSHAQYLMTDNAPETKKYFMESSHFFNKFLKK